MRVRDDEIRDAVAIEVVRRRVDRVVRRRDEERLEEASGPVAREPVDPELGRVARERVERAVAVQIDEPERKAIAGAEEGLARGDESARAVAEPRADPPLAVGDRDRHDVADRVEDLHAVIELLGD